jgi:hypothetical protein
MIPTAFSAASAIYCEIGDKPADEFVYCPNAIPALSAGFGSINVHSSGRDKYAPAAWRPFDALHMSKRCRALQRCNAVPAGQQKECAVGVAITKPAL